MIPETDTKIIAAKLCEFARTNFVAEGVDFDEHSPLSEAGIDSFALVELVLFCERVLGVRVPDSHLTGDQSGLHVRAGQLHRRTGAEQPALVVKYPAAIMPDLPRQIRLAAGDYFMHGQDRRMRQVGLPGNVCCAVIKLGEGFDAERLRRRIAGSPIMDWLARAKISRTLPMLFPPLWRLAEKPEEIFFAHQNQNGVADQPWNLPPVVAGRELDAARGPGIVFDVMRHADGTSHLFLSWNHTHLDARGLDFLLNHLNADETMSSPKAPNFISPETAWLRPGRLVAQRKTGAQLAKVAG